MNTQLAIYLYLLLLLPSLLWPVTQYASSPYRAPYDAAAIEIVLPLENYDLTPLYSLAGSGNILLKEFTYLKAFLHKTHPNVVISIYVEAGSQNNTKLLGIRVQIPILIENVTSYKVAGELSLPNIEALLIQAASKYEWEAYLQIIDKDLRFYAFKDSIEVYGIYDKVNKTLNVSFLGLHQDVESILNEIRELLESITGVEIDLSKCNVSVETTTIPKYKLRYNLSLADLRTIMINELRFLKSTGVIDTKFDLTTIINLINSTVTLGSSGIEGRLVFYHGKLLPYYTIFPPVAEDLSEEYYKLVVIMNENLDEIPYYVVANYEENLSTTMHITVFNARLIAIIATLSAISMLTVLVVKLFKHKHSNPNNTQSLYLQQIPLSVQYLLQHIYVVNRHPTEFKS